MAKKTISTQLSSEQVANRLIEGVFEMLSDVDEGVKKLNNEKGNCEKEIKELREKIHQIEIIIQPLLKMDNETRIKNVEEDISLIKQRLAIAETSKAYNEKSADKNDTKVEKITDKVWDITVKMATGAGIAAGVWALVQQFAK